MAKRALDLVLRYVRTLAVAGEAAHEMDTPLLERFVSRGDDDAFAALVQRHGPLVMGVCRRVLWRHEDAEDAFQATFLVLAHLASASRRGMEKYCKFAA